MQVLVRMRARARAVRIEQVALEHDARPQLRVLAVQPLEDRRLAEENCRMLVLSMRSILRIPYIRYLSMRPIPPIHLIHESVGCACRLGFASRGADMACVLTSLDVRAHTCVRTFMWESVRSVRL
jgi:hypothetical protein